MNLTTDKSREGMDITGIFVRARNHEGRLGSHDIAELNAESLHTFLRSRGGNNPWAENVVAILLGHDTTVSPWTTDKED